MFFEKIYISAFNVNIMVKLNKFEKQNLTAFSNDKSITVYNKYYLKPTEKYLINKYLFKNNKILDLGCGAGRTTIPLSKKFNVIGVDISETLINSAKQQSPSLFKVMDAKELKFSDNTFDLVFFSFNGIDYLYPKKNRMKTVEEINRVLKSGGYFIYSSHNWLNFPFQIHRLKTLLTMLKNKFMFKKINYVKNKQSFGELIQFTGTVFNEIKTIKRKGFKYKEICSEGRFRGINNKYLVSLIDGHPHYVFQKK